MKQLKRVALVTKQNSSGLSSAGQGHAIKHNSVMLLLIEHALGNIGNLCCPAQSLVSMTEVVVGWSSINYSCLTAAVWLLITGHTPVLGLPQVQLLGP